jgi:hypothetical protein
VLSLEELHDALVVGNETRGFEFKTNGARTDGRFFAKVARAALSMGNLRDGGYVVIGIDDARPQDMLPGLNEAELASWLAYDDVASRLAEYSDPPVEFEVAGFSLSSGSQVAAIGVGEFLDIPHLCARDFSGVLRKGALYVRSRRMPQSAEVASSVEMREILDLAAEKRLRAYVESASRAGVALALSAVEALDQQSQDSEAFEAQRRAVWG